jgi:hypothetical protein
VTVSAAFVAHAAGLLSSLVLCSVAEVRDVAQARGEPGDRCRVFDPFGESGLDS